MLTKLIIQGQLLSVDSKQLSMDSKQLAMDNIAKSMFVAREMRERSRKTGGWVKAKKMLSVGRLQEKGMVEVRK